jgi:hypothetical protein
MRHGEYIAHIDSLRKRTGESEEEYEKSEKLRIEVMRQQLERQYGRSIRVAVSPPHIRGHGESADIQPTAYYFYIETDWSPYGPDYS